MHHRTHVVTALAIAAIITLVGCSSAKVFIDYDREADLDSYRTFAWAESEETSVLDTSPLIHKRLVSHVTDKLVAGGLTQVESDPDLYVTYHTDEQEEMVLNTTSFGYGYGYGYYRNPYWGTGIGTTSTRSYTYTQGTLIIDIWDAKKETLVWRGVMEDVVPKNPAEAEARIIAAVDKMVKLWQAERR